MPNFRTELYATWRACERIGILPPEIKGSWDDNGVYAQSQILAYDRVRSHEECPPELSK